MFFMSKRGPDLKIEGQVKKLTLMKKDKEKVIFNIEPHKIREEEPR